MSIPADALRRLAALRLAPEAMSEVLSILADIQQPEEERLAKQRDKKRRQRAVSASVPASVPGTVPGQERDMSPQSPLDNKNPPAPPKTINPPSKREPPKGVSHKGSRLPDDWQPSEGLSAYAAKLGLTGDWLRLETEKFRNWAFNANGDKAVKRDWDRAFQNWLIEAAGKGPPKVAIPPPTNGQEDPAERRAKIREWQLKTYGKTNIEDDTNARH